MQNLDVEQLRGLINLIAPLHTLHSNAEQYLHMELYEGTADLAIANYRGLHANISQIVGKDAYLESLRLEINDALSDKQKMAQLALMASQLLAYVGSVTGVGVLLADKKRQNIQTAPYIIINTSGSSEDNKQRVLDFLREAVPDQDDQDTAAKE